MTATSRCPSCPQITRFVRDHYSEIGSATAVTGAIAASLYDPSYAVASGAIAASSVFATIAKHMRGPSPLQGRVIDPFAELPAEDRANPQNLILLYQHLPTAGPLFPDATTPLEQALEIWRWLHRPEQQEFLLGFRGRFDFKEVGLTALPSVIGLFRNITELDLSSNQLRALPPEIGRLTALTGLYLGSNQLEALPLEIGRLTALTWLDLANNQLRALPPEIGRLTALTSLYLYRNQLAALPPEIGELTALISLFLSRNQLRFLPPEIGELTALISLNLSSNQLRFLPPEIGGLTALTSLDLDSNQLRVLPPEIRQIPRLRIIGFDNIPHPPTATLEENLRSSAEVFINAFPAHLLENAKYYEGDRVCDFRELLSIDPDNLERFSKFFPRIAEMADFANGTPETQKNVILQVDRMVQLACKNPEFRQEMLQILEAGENGCGINRRPACADRILTLFNEIEIAWQFHHKKLSRGESRELALQEGRYKWIEKIGRTMAQKYNNSSEELETILRLQLELKDECKLPITSTFMMFPNLSRVTQEMIEEAKKELRSIPSTELLTKSEHWLKHQAEQYPEEVAKIEEEHAHLDAMATEYYKTKDAKTQAKILEENPRLVTLLETLEIKYDAALSNAIMKARLEAIASIGEIRGASSKVFESKVQG